VDPQRLGNDIADTLATIHRRVGVLEHHLHAPAQRSQGAAARASDILAVEIDVTARRRIDLENCAAKRGLARSAFADQADRLAPFDGKVHLIQRMHHASGTKERAPHRKVLTQVVNPEQRCHAYR
jgi:hypothetical protein